MARIKTERTCPLCGKTYTWEPAISREDGKTELCPDCGVCEALDSIGASEQTKAEVLDAIHKVMEAGADGESDSGEEG